MGTTTTTPRAFIDVEVEDYNGPAGVTTETHHEVEIIDHREGPRCRLAKVRHVGPIPAGGRRVYWADAEDIIVEAADR